MRVSIRNIVFACPDPPALARFYADLLGMKIIRRDWDVIAPSEDSRLRLAFGDGEWDYQAPRWPDPDYPQQMHLDLPVRDLDAAEEMAIRLGATRLEDRGHERTYADPAGHPFCLYLDGSVQGDRAIPGRIGRIVFDCLSPRALAAFYADLMEMRTRVADEERQVEIAGDDPEMPHLAFQHAVFAAPRWPDPRFPQQIHLDLDVEVSAPAQERALRLGAIRLPAEGGSCPVFADPAGHPFCLCAPGE